MVIMNPSSFIRARIDRPILLPAPSNGMASTFSTGSMLRIVTSPLTGSITVGAEPQSVRDVLFSFQVIPVFAERAVATRRRLCECVIGSGLIEVTIIEQNSFSTVTDIFFNALLLSLTNPIRACDFSVSMVTSPLPFSERYQRSSPVSETIGLSTVIFGYCPDCALKPAIRVVCRRGKDRLKPGVKYGRPEYDSRGANVASQEHQSRRGNIRHLYRVRPNLEM